MAALGPPPWAHRPGGPADTFGARPVRLEPLDVAAVGAALAALVLSFFDFYTYAPTVLSRPECAQITPDTPGASDLSALCAGDSASAWHGFFGWCGILLGVMGAGLIAHAAFSRRVQVSGGRRSASAVLYGLGLISMVIALPMVPDWPPLASVFGIDNVPSSLYDQRISNGHGVFYWLDLALLGVGVLTAGLGARRAGGHLPAFLSGQPAGGGAPYPVRGGVSAGPRPPGPPGPNGPPGPAFGGHGYGHQPPPWAAPPATGVNAPAEGRAFPPAMPPQPPPSWQ